VHLIQHDDGVCLCCTEDGLLSFLRHHDWEILTLEAHLHVPSDDEQQKTLVKVNLESNGGGQCSDPESGS